MRLPERVAEIIETTNDKELRSKVLKMLDDWKTLSDQGWEMSRYHGGTVTFEELAFLAAAFIRELTRHAPADAPRVYKRVMEDSVKTRDGVG